MERAQSARLLAAAAQPGRLWPSVAGQRGSAAQRRARQAGGDGRHGLLQPDAGARRPDAGRTGQEGRAYLGAIVAYHPYSQQPEGDDPARDFALRAQQINARLRQVKAPAIWATEWGWSSYAGPKEEQELIGRDGQADYLLRRLALMSALDYDRIFLFALLCTSAPACATAATVYVTLPASLPAYQALARFLAATGPRLNPAPAPQLDAAPDDLYSVGWRKPDGTRLWMFWSASGGAAAGHPRATLHQP